jgi:hypothetical protein
LWAGATVLGGEDDPLRGEGGPLAVDHGAPELAVARLVRPLHVHEGEIRGVPLHHEHVTAAEGIGHHPETLVAEEPCFLHHVRHLHSPENRDERIAHGACLHHGKEGEVGHFLDMEAALLQGPVQGRCDALSSQPEVVGHDEPVDQTCRNEQIDLFDASLLEEHEMLPA